MQQFNPILQTVRPSFVSENYGFIKTQPLVESIEASGWTLSKTRFAKVRDQERAGLQKHELVFRNENYNNDRESVPQLILRNSHDRTAALEFHLGFFRFVCSNGLIVGSSIMSSMKVFHTGKDLETKINQKINETLLNVPLILEARDEMRATILTVRQELDFVNEATELVKSIRKYQELPLLYNLQRADDVGSSLWNVFNVVQENSLSALTGIRTSTNDKGEVMRRVSRSRKITSLDIDTKLNKGLFDIAAQYLGKAGA